MIASLILFLTGIAMVFHGVKVQKHIFVDAGIIAAFVADVIFLSLLVFTVLWPLIK